MTKIYKVTLYYYYGDSRPELCKTLYITCTHKPSLTELENNEIIQQEMVRNHCEYIDISEMASKDKVKYSKIIVL